MVWHSGDFSIAEVSTRPIEDGYPNGNKWHLVRQERNEQHQLPEELFKAVFLQAIALCGLQPDHVVTFYRQDKESEVGENPNNAPFRGPTKTMEYEGTIYHSDMSEIRKYDMKDIKQKMGAVKRRERKMRR